LSSAGRTSRRSTCCSTSPSGVLWFTLFTTAIALGVSLLITLVGLPILTATFLLARGGAWLERLRARALLGVEIPAPVERAGGNGLWAKLVAPFRNRTTWKQLFYLWLVQPVQSLVNFTVTLVRRRDDFRGAARSESAWS
jgi:hypothetical protein